MEQVNTRHNRTSGTSRTNLQWTKCSARATKLQSLTALIKPRTIVVEVKDWGSSVQQVNAINDQGSHILQIIQNMYIIISLIVVLVGGSGPQEGNIMVNGEPVCDDGSEAYRAATAAVVCRFIHISNDAEQLTILNFIKLVGTNYCLLMKFLFLFVFIFYTVSKRIPIFGTGSLYRDLFHFLGAYLQGLYYQCFG